MSLDVRPRPRLKAGGLKGRAIAAVLKERTRQKAHDAATKRRKKRKAKKPRRALGLSTYDHESEVHG